MEQFVEKTTNTEFKIFIATNVALVLAVFGLFAWNRSESRADYRHHDQILQAMQEDIRDFHTKLYVLEEKYYQLNEEKK